MMLATFLIVDIFQRHEKSASDEYRRSFHLEVFQGTVSTEKREYII